MIAEIYWFTVPASTSLCFLFCFVLSFFWRYLFAVPCVMYTVWFFSRWLDGYFCHVQAAPCSAVQRGLQNAHTGTGNQREQLLCGLHCLSPSFQGHGEWVSRWKGLGSSPRENCARAAEEASVADVGSAEPSGFAASCSSASAWVYCPQAVLSGISIHVEGNRFCWSKALY